VTGSYDHSLHLWRVRNGELIATLTQVGSLSFSPNGWYLVSSCGGGDCAANPEHIWSIPDGNEIVTYRGHDNTVFATAVSPDGQMVATGGGDNHENHLWSLRDGQLQQRLSGVGAAIWAVGFSADGGGNWVGGKTWEQRRNYSWSPKL